MGSCHCWHPRMTVYGRQSLKSASFLGSNGVTVVSGLARGVDSTAHSAAR